MPSKRALVLSYKNKFKELEEFLELKGVNCTSAHPLTTRRKDWRQSELLTTLDCDGKLHSYNACKCRMF